jgi:hypothetical protein
VLPQCPALAHLNLTRQNIDAAGAESVAGLLARSPQSLQQSDWRCWSRKSCRSAEQFTALTHLNLNYNHIGAARTKSLAAVLGMCAVLAHLDLSGNQIGDAGAESLAGVLGQCAALAYLNLEHPAVTSALSGKGGFELCGVVKPLALFCRLGTTVWNHTFFLRTKEGSWVLWSQGVSWYSES